MIDAKNVTLVVLEDINVGHAYAMGFEAGAFVQYDDDQLVGRHIIFTENAVMIEMIASDRGFHTDITAERGDRLIITIGRR